ncbi:MAG TPA: FtsQ-type POTRA domain-containing protein [Clostridia bacterium]
MAEKSRHIGLAVILAIIASIAAIVLLFPQFRCADIRVEGLRILNREDVLAASGLTIGQHLLTGLGPDPVRAFSLRYGGGEDRIAALSPYVRSVRIRMVFPSAIRIEVEERIEVAYLAIPDGCVVIDAQGVAVEILYGTAPQGIPVIDGATVTSVVLGQALKVDDEASIRSAIVIMDAIIKSDREDGKFSLFKAVAGLRSVDADTTYMTVVLPAKGDQLVVRIGTLDKIAETVDWLRGAIANGYCDGLGKGVLDLSGTQKVFRPDAK